MLTGFPALLDGNNFNNGLFGLNGLGLPGLNSPLSLSPGLGFGSFGLPSLGLPFTSGGFAGGAFSPVGGGLSPFADSATQSLFMLLIIKSLLNGGLSSGVSGSLLGGATRRGAQTRRGGGRVLPADGRPVDGGREPAPIIEGPAQTQLNDNGLSFSGQALSEVWADPANARNIVERELAAVVGSNQPADILKRLIGVDIKTGFSEERKTLMAFQLYQDVLDTVTNNLLGSLGLPEDVVVGPQNSVIDRGGIVLAQGVRDQITQNPANARMIIENELANATMQQDKIQIVERIVGTGELDTGDKQEFADELYGYILDDLVERTT